MSLKERLMGDLKSAMKNREKLQKNVITMVRSAIKQREIDERIELSDEDILAIISKQVKQKRGALEDFSKGNREDLVELTKKEIDILLDYLPRQLSEVEIEEIVKEAIEAVGATTKKDMGKIMAYMMPKIKGRADGGIVNKIVMQHLK